MKHFKAEKLLSVLLALAMIFSTLPIIRTQAAGSGDYRYNVLDEAAKTCEITSYFGGRSDVTVPSVIDGYTVTSIGSDAFSNYGRLISISIPDSVTTIGHEAFRDCSSLTSFTIPDSVTTIGYGAFQGCVSLESVAIGNGIAEIGAMTFEDCTSLTSIVIPASITSIENSAFRNCSNLKSITIPDGVTKIGEWAFMNCSGLVSVTIGNSVRDIMWNAFSGCAGLTSIKIPDSVTTIGSDAFGCCHNLTSVIIGKGLTSITSVVFCHCPNLRSITIDDDNPAFFGLDGVIFNKGKTELFRCLEGKKGNYIIPNTVTTIKGGSFYGCTGIKSVVIPKSVTNIEEASFSSCANLNLEDVYYAGTASEKYKITIGDDNYPLLNATWHYNSTGPKPGTEPGTEPETEPGTEPTDVFSMQRSTWSFVNDHEGFSYPEDYSIPEERYAEVLGASYVAAAKAGDEEKFNSMMPKWGGNCQGMSETAILFHLGKLDWDDYDKLYEPDFPTVNSYYRDVRYYNKILWEAFVSSCRDTAVTKLIENYQIFQYSNQYSRDFCGLDIDRLLEGEYWGDPTSQVFKGHLIANYPHKPSGKYISILLEKIKENINKNIPLLLSLYFNDGAHAIVIRTDRKPECYDGWWRVYVYDPNTPYMNPDLNPRKYKHFRYYYYNNLAYGEDTYIELNTAENKWRYCTALNSDSSNSWWGCNKNGEVKYKELKLTEGEEKVTYGRIPEHIDIENLSSLPTSFDGSDRWWKPKINGSSNTADISFTGKSTFDVCANDGSLICTVYKGELVSGFDKVEYMPYVGITIDGNGGAGGRITVPFGDFIVEYESGDDITITGNGSVFNISAPGEVTLKVSTADSKVEIVGGSDNQIVAQTTDVYSGSVYSSVYMVGNLNRDDSAALQLKNNKLALENGITGDSRLVVFTDNDENRNEQYITTMEANKPRINKDNIRTCTTPEGICIIHFDANGGSGMMAPAVVEQNTNYTLPECGFTAPEGKEFDRWDKGAVGENITVSDNLTKIELKAIYHDTTAAYKVIHKLQKLDGVTYEEKKAEDMRGNIGELTTAEAENFEGFNVKDFRQVEINADGSTEVIIEYDRTKCTLSFDTKGGSKVNPITVLYEDDASKHYIGDPTKEGFTFKGWYLNPECTGEKYTIGTLKADLTLYAKWEKEVPTAPETGDNSQLGLWLAIDLAVLSGTAILLFLAKKRKQA